AGTALGRDRRGLGGARAGARGRRCRRAAGGSAGHCGRGRPRRVHVQRRLRRRAAPVPGAAARGVSLLARRNARVRREPVRRAPMPRVATSAVAPRGRPDRRTPRPWTRPARRTAQTGALADLLPLVPLHTVLVPGAAPGPPV